MTLLIEKKILNLAISWKNFYFIITDIIITLI
jgi:hypothetical protein